MACPTDDPASGALCEFADGFCFPKGNRTVTINGSTTTESSPLNFCFADRFQNGDLDFDGTDYRVVYLARRDGEPPDSGQLHRAVHYRRETLP